MKATSEKEKIKALKANPKIDAEGSMTVTVNGQAPITAEDFYVMSGDSKGFVAFIKEGQGIVVVEFHLLVEPGTYEVERYRLWIEVDYSGYEGVGKTGALTLETLVPQKRYKGSFDVKTIDHRKMEGEFEVRII
ncbi:hypothetical protein J2W43_002739 [Pseudomonas brassicacearum]|uniref:Uncharacterized protein n=1 Tax=Pseudomonas brassicacearum TaxID=930166 RepID=A0AAW8MCD8_9PSED|nr:hypothetical protein [Pseudomonas brassicacearum]MDR6958752.1 hypothetical protein [Pseudomonas brassicacearum]